MPFARLIAYLPLFILLCLAVPSYAAENEQVAAELHKIIDSGEPVMGDQQTDDRIAYAIKVLNERGIAMSGDALQGGIGAMTDRRWKEFYDSMVAVGVLPPGLDVGLTHTLAFVNKGIGKP